TSAINRGSTSIKGSSKRSRGTRSRLSRLQLSAQTQAAGHLFPGGSHGTTRQTRCRSRGATVPGDGGVVPAVPPARGWLQGEAGRSRGGPDVSEQARLSGQKRQGGQGRQC